MKNFAQLPAVTLSLSVTLLMLASPLATAKGNNDDSKTILEIKELIDKRHKKDDCWLELDLGDLYLEIDEVDNAISCFERAANLASSGKEYIHLIWAWENVLRHRPFDPKCHLALASAFRNSFNPQLENAAIHCQRAIFLSENHHNPEAEHLLEIVRKQQSTVKEKVNTLSKRKEGIKNTLVEKWSPPSESGYLVTRFFVTVDNPTRFLKIDLFARSGSSSFDRSASMALRKAPYFTELTSGLYDFVFVNDSHYKTIDYARYDAFIPQK